VSESAESSLAGETDTDRSQVVQWWLGLDSGWQATALGLVAIACSFAAGLL
jgi:hypothetical protein